MKKIFLLVVLSFFVADLVSAQATNMNASMIPLVPAGNCERPRTNGGLGGTCVPLPSIVDDNAHTACDLRININSTGEDITGKTDFVGFCEGGGFYSGQRRDCCVPKNTITAEDVTRNRSTSWFEESLCERPRAQGGVGGSCLTAKSGINPLNFTDSCSSYTATPNFLGYCGGGRTGIFWRSGIETWVCCGSDNAVENLGGNVGPTNIQYGDYQLLEMIPGSSNTSGRLQPYLESIYKAGFVLIVLGAVVMIGIGGFTYMASAGNTAMIKKGKGMITDALVGLVVALLVWLVLNIINPDLVRLQIDPLPGLSFDPSGGGATTAANNDSQAGAANGQTLSLTLRGGGTAEVHACAAGDGERVTIPFLGHSATIHRNLAPSLRRIDARWRELGGNSFYRVTSVGGYNCRNATNSSRLSYHAYGLVVDINPAQNPYRGDNVLVTDMPVAFRNLFTSEGWGWGGNWRSAKDAMHFSKASGGEQGDMRGE